MKKSLCFSIILLFTFIIFGCGEKIPEVFKTQAMKFMEEGSSISSVTKTGVSYIEMRNLYVKAQGTYGLLEATWPKDKFPEAKKAFENSLKAWDFSLRLWKHQINLSNDEDYAPTEPNNGGYLEYVTFAHDNNIQLVFKVHANKDRYNKNKFGKKYIPYRENVSLFMTVGSEEFEKGRKILLEKLK